jgi:leucyl/phenylalanyl-tRNA--protein transferase
MGTEAGISWYSPDPRCIIELEHFHVPKRLARTYRQGHFDLRVNTAWDQVIRYCAARQETWITEEIIEAYTQLHEDGFAHSVEAYREGRLVGGLYGVSLGGAFMGESMFHVDTDASKVCLVYLVQRMKERGYELLDSQFVTNHLQNFGAILITRINYLARLKKALARNVTFE